MSLNCLLGKHCTIVFWILRKTRSFVFLATILRFVVLTLKTVRKCQARISVTILRYDVDHVCSSEILQRIKGKTVDWTLRWQRGDLCYVAYADGEPIAYLWICHGEWRVKDEDKGSKLPSRSALVYDGITRKQWRSNGVLKALLVRSASDLRSSGHDYIYGIVGERNTFSRRALSRVGFRDTEHYICLYRFFRFFNLRRDKVKILGD
ncbi:MAG: GNAT family N-acetyltransferase [Planctomycetota bacterium]|jgi:hypothetical protein